MYAISYSTPEEHSLLQDKYKLDNFEFLSEDESRLEFGVKFGFYDIEENYLYRGYVGVNPESENMAIEVDYLVGDKINEILKTMDEL